MPIHPTVLYGDSATGKSTMFYPIPEIGVQGVPLEKLFVINCAGHGKMAPVRGAKASMFQHSNEVTQVGNHWFTAKTLEVAGKALKAVIEKREDINYILVDDIGIGASKAIVTSEAKMEFEDWRVLGVHLQNLLNIALSAKAVNRHVFVFFVFHAAHDPNTTATKVFLPGMLLEKYVSGIEGQFVTVLNTFTAPDSEDEEKTNYFIRLCGNKTTAKTLPLMFEGSIIPSNIMTFIQGYADYFNFKIN